MRQPGFWRYAIDAQSVCGVPVSDGVDDMSKFGLDGAVGPQSDVWASQDRVTICRMEQDPHRVLRPRLCAQACPSNPPCGRRYPSPLARRHIPKQQPSPSAVVMCAMTASRSFGGPTRSISIPEVTTCFGFLWTRANALASRVHHAVMDSATGSAILDGSLYW